MTSEVWKIGQETKAEDFYTKASKEISQVGIFAIPAGEVVAVSRLTNICQEMINAYEEVIDDQNEYILEIDDMVLKAEDTAKEIQKRIEQLEKEIVELIQKEESGEITQEERGELSAKQSELENLRGLLKTTGDKENKDIKSKNEQRKTEYRSKEKIATEYGETTVEKGMPLARTKVKGGFFRKLFGTTGKHKKQVGEKAVLTGNNLLDKVAESSKAQEKIDTKIKTEK